MKNKKCFDKKEVDLTKVSIPVLNEHGKKEAIKGIKKITVTIIVLLALAFLGFIFNELYKAKIRDQKEKCDSLVFSFYWEQKNMQEKMDAGMIVNEFHMTYTEKQSARRTFKECDSVYDNGYERR